MKPTQPVLQPLQPQSKNPYKILFFITLGLFLTTASLLIYIWLTVLYAITLASSKPVVADKIVDTETVNETTPFTTEPEIPSDWKTYTDSTYKFSINYPSTWTIDTNSVDNRVVSISSPEKIESINNPITSEGYSGDDFLVQAYDKTLTDCQNLEICFGGTGDEVSNIRKVKIGELDGYLVDEAGMATTSAYFIFNSTKLFKITSFISFSKTEKQILDTFKFN